MPSQSWSGFSGEVPFWRNWSVADRWIDPSQRLSIKVGPPPPLALVSQRFWFEVVVEFFGLLQHVRLLVNRLNLDGSRPGWILHFAVCP